MAITINGAGTIGGISVGGLPDGIVDTDMLAASAVTTAKTSFTGDLAFNSGYGSAATAYGVRAWINFDGTSGSIGSGRASGNVTSVTDNGTGDYTVNFATAMPDANYCIATDFGNQTSGGTAAGTLATGSFKVITMDGNFALADRSIVFAAVFR